MGQLDNFEWLERQLHQKTCRFDVGTGGTAEVDWQDKCGALAKLDHHEQDLTLLICNIRHIDTARRVANRLAQLWMLAAIEDKRGAPRKCNYGTLKDLASAVAMMALNVFLYHDQSWFTTAGRMALASIQGMTEDAYRDTWDKYEQLVWNRLYQLHDSADMKIGEYREAMSA